MNAMNAFFGCGLINTDVETLDELADRLIELLMDKPEEKR